MHNDAEYYLTDGMRSPLSIREAVNMPFDTSRSGSRSKTAETPTEGPTQTQITCSSRHGQRSFHCMQREKVQLVSSRPDYP